MEKKSKFSQLKGVFSDNKLYELCLITGKSPKDIVKEYYNNKNNIDLWNIAHQEKGILRKVKKEEYEQYKSHVLVATWEPFKKYEDRETVTTRSIFLYDEEMYDKMMSLIDKKCIFWVSYTENKDEDDIYRNLIDIDEIK